MGMDNDVEALDGVDLQCDVDMERDGDCEDEYDEEEDDEKKEEREDGNEEEDANEDEDEDEDEDGGKEPRTMGLGEMANTSADDLDTIADDQPIMLPEEGQEMREHTPRPQPSAPATPRQTLEPHPRP
jgi:hypothetical protein